MRIKPVKRLRGSLRLPGDKSISHRAAIIAALAQGRTRLDNFSTSQDSASTLSCLKQLGVRIEQQDTTVSIEGSGPSGLRAPLEPLDCGNSGSTMRMLAGVLAAQDFVSELTGDESLRARPMQRIIEPLTQMSAHISSTEGRAPLVITGQRPLKPVSYRMPVKSAQVKSCILLAGLGADGLTEVIEETASTRDHTERMLRWFNVPLVSEPEAIDPLTQKISLRGLSIPRARDVEIPGDISSAVFFMIAAAALPGSELEIKDVCLNPTRAEIIRTMQELGAQVIVKNERESCNEAIGDIHVRGANALSNISSNQTANNLRGQAVARLIDELPALAVFGTQVAGGLVIHDAQELRVKESDRIRATVENLRAMGALVEEYDDGLRVVGRVQLRGTKLDSYGDHRIAMAFTIAALLAEGESEIAGADCASVSLPEFYRLLESVIER